MSRRKIASLNRKKRSPSKEFLELYDAIWEGTAPVNYRNPERWREHPRREEQ